MTLPNEYWESLGISIEDITDREAQLKGKICRRLANKLEKLSEDCLPELRRTYKVRGKSLLEALQFLYHRSKDEFRELFALAVFAERKINPEIIYSIASRKLNDSSLSRRISDKTIDSLTLLLILLKDDPQNLRQIYYDYLTQRSTFKKFVCEPRLSDRMVLNRFGFEKIESLLQEFETTRSYKQNRPVKLWWFDSDDEKGRIVFRREKSARSELRLVRRNEFHKTGDEKIFLFSDYGNVLDVFSRREPSRTVKIAEFIVRKLTGQKARYHEVINQYDSVKVDEFIDRLITGKIGNAKLLSIKVRNVPLVNSPMIELACSESLMPTLKDLEENHDLNLMTRSADVLSLRIQVDGRAYSLRTRAEGNEIEFITDNRNLLDTEKGKISEFLTEQIGRRQL
jgi:hypothetical protein